MSTGFFFRYSICDNTNRKHCNINQRQTKNCRKYYFFCHFFAEERITILKKLFIFIHSNISLFFAYVYVNSIETYAVYEIIQGNVMRDGKKIIKKTR